MPLQRRKRTQACTASWARKKAGGWRSRGRFEDMYAMFPVLLIEQKLAVALRTSDRALVMGHGRIVFQGTPKGLSADPGVRREWLEV